MANNHEKVNQTSERSEFSNEEAKQTNNKVEEVERRPRNRFIPIWLRLLLVVLLLVASLVAGAMIGYGVIGDGSPGDVFKKETWVKITDIVKKEKK
ncbi:DNA-directed RNA polymerase subunit beta [Pseudalkalibacillus hwajinpoensis]|uniref:DNA-directed RNA polymerase subunit beta n=1 Tax=Guptibacillus hwajinpoensis TaxID=208199 RepID=UPI00325A6B68